MNQMQKREIVSTLLKAGRRDLAVAVTDMEKTSKAMKNIAEAWDTCQKNFLKALKQNEADLFAWEEQKMWNKKEVGLIKNDLVEMTKRMRKAGFG